MVCIMTANISIQNQLTYTSVINKKTEEKNNQTANCSALASVLGGMIQITNRVKGETTPTPVIPSGTTTPSECSSMEQMIALLAELQSLIGKMTQTTGDANGALLKASIELTKANAEAVLAQNKAFTEKQQKQKKWNIFKKVFATIAAVLVTLVNPEMLLVTLPLILSTWDPKLSLTNGLSKAIQFVAKEANIPISKETADLIASVIVCVVIMFLTAGAGAEEGIATVAEEAGGEGIEMDNLGADADQVVEEEASSTPSEKSEPSKTKSLFKVLTAGSIALTQSNLINSMALICDPSMSDDTKEKIALISGIILSLITLVSTFGGMAATTTSSLEAGSSTLSTAKTKMIALIKQFRPSMSNLQTSLFVASLFQGTAQIGGAVIQSQLADLYKQIGSTKGMGELISALNSLIKTGMSQSAKTQNATMSAHSEAMTQSLSAWEKEWAAIANTMTA